MTRYISDRDIAALAQSDQPDGFDPGMEEGAPALSFRVLAGITAGAVAAIVVAWVAVDQFAGDGPVPLVTASSEPIKIRPQTPGGLEIPFQNMALYERIQPPSQPVTPVLNPSAEQPNREVLAPPASVAQVRSGVMQDGEALQLQAPPPATAIQQSATAPPLTIPVIPANPSLAQGEGESLFAATAAPPAPAEPGQVAPAIQPVPLDAAPIEGAPGGDAPSQAASAPLTAADSPVGDNTATAPVTPVPQVASIIVPPGTPPVPPRHPTRFAGANTAADATVNTSTNSFFPTAADSNGDVRRIRRGTIASQQVPLDAAQGGLRPGGALGLTDDSGNLVFRNNVRQNTTAPLPTGPVEGEVELVMQAPAGTAPQQPSLNQPPAISVSPERPIRAADGTIEIRSPNRAPIEIRSGAAGAAPDNAPPGQATVTPPSLIPQPPSRAVGPATNPDQLTDGDQIAAAQPPVAQARPLSEVNTLPNTARAPAPVSTAITRGSVVNQRAPAPGAPQAPITEPTQQAGQQQAAIPQAPPQPQRTSVSSIPPSVSTLTPPANGGEGWRIQLASVGSQDAAMGEWRRFQRANSDLLGNLNLKIQRADLGARGVFFRVQAGVLDRDGANRVCQALKSRGTDCLVTRD